MKKMLPLWAVLLLPCALVQADDEFDAVADATDLVDASVDTVSSDVTDSVQQEVIDAINNIIDSLGLREWYDNEADEEARFKLIGLIVELLETTQGVASQYGDIFQRIQDLTQVEIQEFTANLRFAAQPASN